jgi:hypothetical protein
VSIADKDQQMELLAASVAAVTFINLLVGEGRPLG